jgi:hypothetical protein
MALKENELEVYCKTICSLAWETRADDLAFCGMEPIESYGLEKVFSIFLLWTIAIAVAVTTIVAELIIASGDTICHQGRNSINK